jgi:ADP-ribosylglycohydrolase
LKHDFYDGVYGCIIGHTIGDALGAPVEGWNYWDIRKAYGKVERFYKSAIGNQSGPAGGTDDTTLRHYVSVAIVRKGGRISPNDLARLWIEKGSFRYLWSNEQVAYERIFWGMDPWDSGRGAIKCGSAAMGAAPVGIINAGDPEQAYQDGYVIASLNQDGEERAAAGLLAAGIAKALEPSATLDQVLRTMDQLASFPMKRALDLTFDLAASCTSADEFTEKYYERLSDWAFPLRPTVKLPEIPMGMPRRAQYYSGASVELVPVALAMVQYAKGDANRAIADGASFGRDCDTIGAMAGAFAGALEGAHAIRGDWIAECEKANGDLFEFLEGDRSANFASVSKRLVDACRRQQETTKARAAAMERILSQKG